MGNMLRSNVLAAKARLAKGLEDFKARHAAGCPGVELCALNCNLRDAVIRELLDDALRDLGEDGPKGLLNDIAVVAYGGYGRRDVAPYSDVDLMVLHRKSAAPRLLPLAERLVRDVFDAGLELGHSVRTVAEALRMATRDPVICTSLIDSRLLAGSPAIFEGFMHSFRQGAAWRRRRLLAGIRKCRNEERRRFGETVFLLEPNIKRSRGTLRDAALLRWIGFVRYGLSEFSDLRDAGILSQDDCDAIEPAYAFLLWLRNELHLHAGQANDVLSRAEQLRIAEGRCGPWNNETSAGGLLPVERFMQDYFRHTNRVSHVAARFMAKATTRPWLDIALTQLFGHRIEREYLIGPVGLMATRRGLAKLRGNLTAIMQMVDLANQHDVRISACTWEAVRREAARLPRPASGYPLPPEASRHFLSLLSHPGRLGKTLRELHDMAILERFLPDFARARGLLQFNQYHKYTVDEHCIRAVEFAEGLLDDLGPVGRVYRGLKDKHLLHLALLVHDLGKGLLEDHREAGLTIAEQTGSRLGLKPHETETLKFLVHKHLRMNHLALRRDTSDEDLVVRFAVQVGSPELLQMLYVLTAADLGAVGPDVWDGWKSQVLTDLYHRAMQQLAGDSPATTTEHLYEGRREEIRNLLCGLLSGEGDKPWFRRHIDALVPGYLGTVDAPQAAADLRLLHDLEPGGVRVTTSYEATSATLQVTVGTSEAAAPGIFHKLTGALTSQGLEIRSAQIHTLADGLVLDRFWVHDPDYAGQPPAVRIDTIGRAVEQSLRMPPCHEPAFRRTWQMGQRRKAPGPKPQLRVNSDNSTSDRYTIIDVFAYDRTGLLYAVARALFELGCSVWRAKISTHLDQVLDVFYVTDQENQKIEDQERLETIRKRLLEVVGEEAT
jgi:[protein-PII] uridylyltransferase